jgi:hypothetical protein
MFARNSGEREPHAAAPPCLCTLCSHKHSLPARLSADVTSLLVSNHVQYVSHRAARATDGCAHLRPRPPRNNAPDDTQHTAWPRSTLDTRPALRYNYALQYCHTGHECTAQKQVGRRARGVSRAAKYKHKLPRVKDRTQTCVCAELHHMGHSKGNRTRLGPEPPQALQKTTPGPGHLAQLRHLLRFLYAPNLIN